MFDGRTLQSRLVEMLRAPESAGANESGVPSFEESVNNTGDNTTALWCKC